MTTMTNKKAGDAHQEAVDAFIARKAEIDTILERLRGLSDDHFDLAPDDITWGHVGQLDRYIGILRDLSDMAFHKGEYAPRTTA